MDAVNITNLCYLIAAVLFIIGLKGLSHPRTAVRGNLLGATGMLIAVVVTLLDRQIINFQYIIIGLVVGGAIGATMAIKVKMTAMPEMVALLNGFGGIASVLVAGGAYLEMMDGYITSGIEGIGEVIEGSPPLQVLIATVISAIIGTVTFWGSLMAFLKLQGKISDHAGKFKGQVPFNLALTAAAVIIGIIMITRPEEVWLYLAIVAVCSILGLTLVSAIGGADMPVAIALLNSYSGMAASATGFVLNNTALIISGALVGASGLILTNIMCKAMNRSLGNVLIGGLSDAGSKGPSADDVYAGRVKATTAEEIAMLCDGIQRFVVVPGYGMAVSQCQHAVRDLANLLEARGIQVEYAVHPVAGRMPGHMNVLLAEADVPYDKLRTMEEINPTVSTIDVALVIGANDVVNPDARTNPKSVIAGMPIIDIDLARTVIVVKRSLSPGYAGIPNPLFAADNALMFFNDGKKAVNDIIAAVKEAM